MVRLLRLSFLLKVVLRSSIVPSVILSVSDDSVLDLNILWATLHLHMYTIIVDISITFRLLPSVHLAFFRALIQLKKKSFLTAASC